MWCHLVTFYVSSKMLCHAMPCYVMSWHNSWLLTCWHDMGCKTCNFISLSHVKVWFSGGTEFSELFKILKVKEGQRIIFGAKQFHNKIYILNSKDFMFIISRRAKNIRVKKFWSKNLSTINFGVKKCFQDKCPEHLGSFCFCRFELPANVQLHRFYRSWKKRCPVGGWIFSFAEHSILSWVWLY